MRIVPNGAADEAKKRARAAIGSQDGLRGMLFVECRMSNAVVQQQTCGEGAGGLRRLKGDDGGEGDGWEGRDGGEEVVMTSSDDGWKSRQEFQKAGDAQPSRALALGHRNRERAKQLQ
ncbi:uncharacterized protein PSANT_04640 [Moesziomyces antarcticus]|uniref:Uncharacterized protein n=1 Tax=Pseudozyma antarctica TaxID=84753 RepID=A0A5C3FR93_PSEA2|nr:uncharacterized protein PSANT_04640 [Moesziomyces antarcticus]